MSFVLLFTNICALVVLGFTAFRRNEATLFYGLDGNEMMTLAKQQFVWHMNWSGFGYNPFQSLGNIWLPINMKLVPGYAFSLAVNGGEIDPVLSYLVFSIEAFLSAYLISLWLGFGDVVATVSGWGLALVAMPYVGYPKIYAIFGIAPQLTIVLLAVPVMLILYSLAGRATREESALCLLGVALLAIYLAVSQPIFMVLVVPVVLVFSGAILPGAGSRAEMHWKLGGGALVLAALSASGMLSYLYGLFGYTAAAVFKDELLNVRQTWYEVSILFQDEASGISGPLLYTGALGGALTCAWTGRGLQKHTAIGLLAMMGALMAFGALTLSVDFWQGPAPLYFEIVLWPFYAAYAAAFVTMLLRRLRAVLLPLAHRLPVNRPTWWKAMPTDGRIYAMAFIVAAVPIMLLSWVRDGAVPLDRTYHTYPPLLPPIVSLLREEIALKPGDPFRGRVATLTGQSLQKSGISWADLHANDIELTKRYGNDHRTVGLWYYDIPTLFEYNQFMTPPYYLLTRTFLTNDGDRQIRNIMALRKPDQRLLRALGVRFVITDVPESGARLRAQVDHEGRPALYLYELDGVNLGGYSPTTVSRVSSASEALVLLAREDFDAATTVMADEALSADLVPATSSLVSVEKTGLRLVATSHGTSIIVLPFEFSHCLELEPAGPVAVPPRLFRANLLQAGVVFTDQLEATLSFFTGPFRHAGCRIEDIRDIDRLKLREEVKRSA